jgi:hypothetical protein
MCSKNEQIVNILEGQEVSTQPVSQLQVVTKYSNSTTMTPLNDQVDQLSFFYFHLEQSVLEDRFDDTIKYDLILVLSPTLSKCISIQYFEIFFNTSRYIIRKSSSFFYTLPLSAT